MSSVAEILAQALASHRSGDLAGAEPLYRRVLAADADHLDALYLLGTMCHALGRPDEAAVILARLLALQPQHAPAHDALGIVWAQQGKLGAAVEAFQLALACRPESIEYAEHLREARAIQELDAGSALADQGNWHEAASRYRRASELKPNFVEAIYNLGVVLANAGQREEATACWRRTIELQPECAPAHLSLGAILEQQGESARAVASYRRALELDPGLTQARNNLSGALVALEKKHRTEEANVAFGAGLTLLDQGHPDEALAHFEEVLARFPDFVEAHYLIGVVLAKRNQWGAAIVRFRQALALEPGHIAACNHLAVSLINAERPGEAAACLRHVLGQQPDFAAARNRVTMPECPARERDELQRLLRQEPDYVEARHNLEIALEHWDRQGPDAGAVEPSSRLLNLQAAERRIHSQNGEDGVIEALFAELGTTNKYFVEFGCGDGSQCNSAYLLEQHWTGLQMDGEVAASDPPSRIQQEFITADNINGLFDKYRVPAEFDFLSIDIDGNDFWVWRQIKARPRVVAIEYNASIPPQECLTIEYEPAFEWSRSDYFGASLLALMELGRRKGYTLVYCERAGVNAFFVANECLPAGFAPLAIEEIYRIPNYSYHGLRHRPETARRMIDPFAGQSTD